MGKVTNLFPGTTAEDADSILKNASGKYRNVLILGYDKDGEFDAVSDGQLTECQALWLLEKFKTRLMHGYYSDD
ncbi:MAG: hypothetical protein ABUJ92_00465 [Desulfobacterales bacterium]